MSKIFFSDFFEFFELKKVGKEPFDTLHSEVFL